MTQTAQFIREVMERTGLSEPDAHLAVSSFLRALAEGLSDIPARRLREQLPAPLAAFLKRMEPVRRLTAEGLFERTAQFEGVRIGLGLEHAEVVLQTIYARLDNETRLLLREDLPQTLLDIAEARPSYHPPAPRPIPAPKMRRSSSLTSLAQGRATSYTPLSEGGAVALPPLSFKIDEALDDDEEI